MPTSRRQEMLDDLERELARRMPTGEVITDPAEVARATALFNRRLEKHPLAVARCSSTVDVQGAVIAARESDVSFSVLSGGHDVVTGSSVRDGGLVIDIRGLDHIDVSDDLATVGGGVTTLALLETAAKHGATPVVGTVGSVGVVGLTLGGGYGNLIGTGGLAIDSLVSAEVVLADGSLVTADDETHPDLFWALRGGGGNFGVVTSVVTRLLPVAEVTSGMFAFPLHQADQVLAGLRQLTGDPSDDRLDVKTGFLATPDGVVVFAQPTWSGDAQSGDAHMEAIRALGDPVIDAVGRAPLAEAVRASDANYPPGNYLFASRILPAPSEAGAARLIRAAEAMPLGGVLNIHHAHGAATRVPVAQTAHAYRDEHLIVEIIGMWADGDGADLASWMDDTTDLLEPVALPGGWAVLTGLDDERRRDAFGSNTERLLAVKERYDPDGVFRATSLPR